MCIKLGFVAATMPIIGAVAIQFGIPIPVVGLYAVVSPYSLAINSLLAKALMHTSVTASAILLTVLPVLSINISVILLTNVFLSVVMLELYCSCANSITPIGVISSTLTADINVSKASLCSFIVPPTP